MATKYRWNSFRITSGFAHELKPSSCLATVISRPGQKFEWTVDTLGKSTAVVRGSAGSLRVAKKQAKAAQAVCLRR